MGSVAFVLECSRGKVPGIRGDLVHFPGGFPVVPLCRPLVVPCSVWTIGESARDSWEYGSLSRRFSCGFPVVSLCRAPVVPCSVWTIGGKCPGFAGIWFTFP